MTRCPILETLIGQRDNFIYSTTSVRYTHSVARGHGRGWVHTHAVGVQTGVRHRWYVTLQLYLFTCWFLKWLNWLLYRSHFCPNGDLNEPSNLRRHGTEIKDETPDRHIRIWTAMLAVCRRVHYLFGCCQLTLSLICAMLLYSDILSLR